MITSESVRSFDELPARKSGPSRLVRELVSIVSRVSLVLLFSLVTMGCSNVSSSRRASPRSRSKSSRRDRPNRSAHRRPIACETTSLEGRVPNRLRVPRALQPAQAQEEPQPRRTSSGTGCGRASAEQRRSRPASRHRLAAEGPTIESGPILLARSREIAFQELTDRRGRGCPARPCRRLNLVPAPFI